ncbi:MAG: hypothetical protein AAB956_01075, partial [Patescibacteria group bacterium]
HYYWLIIAGAAVIILSVGAIVTTLSAISNQPAKVRISWRTNPEHQNAVQYFRVLRIDNNNEFVWLNNLGPQHNGILPPNFSYIEDQLTQTGNYRYYVEAVSKTGQTYSSLQNRLPLTVVNVVCNETCQASLGSDVNTTALKTAPQVSSPLIPATYQNGQKAIACFADRTQPWQDLLRNCELAADNLSVRLDAGVIGKVENKIPRDQGSNGFLCLNGGVDNTCRWEPAQFFSNAADAECNGQFYVCNLYYNLDGNNYAQGNVITSTLTDSVGKNCLADSDNTPGYCSAYGQCLTCADTNGDNICAGGGAAAKSLLTAKAVISPIDCPVNRCVTSGNINEINAAACSGRGRSCNFSQVEQSCAVTTAAGSCYGNQNNRTCTINNKICPANLTTCGTDCCRSGEDCIPVGWGNSICQATPNNCAAPNVFCPNDNSKVTAEARGKGVCCGSDYGCGVEENNGYAFCTQTNRCDPDTEIECRGGIWGSAFATLDMSELSLCCDRATEVCYQDGQSINDTVITGFKNWPLCLTKDGIKECGAGTTKCQGSSSKYQNIFVCCQNGVEYCSHTTETAPYCKRW